MSDQRNRNKKNSYDFFSGKGSATRYFRKKGHPKRLNRSCIKDEFDPLSRFDAVRNSTPSENTENQLPNVVAFPTNEEMELQTQAGYQSQSKSSTFSLFEDEYKREHDQSQLPDLTTLLLDDNYEETQSLSDEGVQTHTESLSKVSEKRRSSAYFGRTEKTPSDYKLLHLEEEYLSTLQTQAGARSQSESATSSLLEDEYVKVYQTQLSDFTTLPLDDCYEETQSLSDEGVQTHTESLSKVSERRQRDDYFEEILNRTTHHDMLRLEEEYLPTSLSFREKMRRFFDKPMASHKLKLTTPESVITPPRLSIPSAKRKSRSQSQIRAENKQEEHILTEDIRQLKEKHPLAQFVVCRTDETLPKRIVIGYNSSLKREENFRMDKSGVEVVFKNPYMTSNEAVFVNNERFMKGRMSYDFNILTCLKVCIDEHASDLWKTHSNLTIITGDYFKCTGGVSSPDPCIVFYCLSKGFIPIDEEPFPTELTFRMGTLKTDVREGYFTLGPTTMRGYPDSFNDPICMGSNIGNQCRDASGSLGLFVDLPHNGKGFLTCCHVLFDCVKPREFSYSHIYDSEVQHVIQPGKSAFCSNTDTACGEILQAKFCPGRSPVSVDAALVKVNRRIPLTGHFVIKTVPQVKEIGYDLDALPVFDTGRVRRKISKHDLEKPLLKSGTSSGLTRSLFRLDGAQVRIIEEGAWLSMDEQLPITMKGQYEVESGSKEPGSLNKPFFIPGDSGSAVFAKKYDGTLTCIGIAIGITSYGTTVVTPIGAVLDALNLKDTDVTKFS